MCTAQRRLHTTEQQLSARDGCVFLLALVGFTEVELFVGTKLVIVREDRTTLLQKPYQNRLVYFQ